MSGKELSVYFHIPFCEKKCEYCHFFVLPNQEPLKERLDQALDLEWKLLLPQFNGKEIPSLYFGGGTPALFGPKRIKKWISKLRPLLSKECEITLEANPENLSDESLEAYLDAGVNRLSLGVQSFSNPLLQILSRKADRSTVVEAIERAHAAGFDNLSIDLMIEVPNQTLSDVQASVEEAIQLPISHLSIYNLTFEPGTSYFKKRESLEPLVVEESERVQMFTWMVERLKKAGFEHYEISAFCRNGKRSLHNSGYWTGRPFLGLGPSAFSDVNEARFRNPAHLGKYVEPLMKNQLAYDFHEKLEPDARIRERFLIHLRLLEGVPKSRFHLHPEFIRGLHELTQNNLIEETESHYKLTSQGILLYDEIASTLI